MTVRVNCVSPDGKQCRHELNKAEWGARKRDQWLGRHTRR
jgi:hypothetical protein